MSRMNDALNALSEEEIDLLNSDPQMLSDFKAKFSEEKRANPVIGGLLGNDVEKGWTNPRNWGEEIGRYFPQTIGAMAGSAAGPMGSVAGAAAGESLRGAMQQLAAEYGYAPRMSTLETVANPIIAAAGEGTVQGVAMGASAAIPWAKRVAAEKLFGALQALPQIQKPAAEMVSRDPMALLRGLMDKSRGLYDQFNQATGTVGLKEAAKKSVHPQDAVSVASLKETVRQAQESAAKQALTPQEAVNASQAARMLGQIAERGHSEINREMGKMYLGEVKPMFDRFLEGVNPVWGQARKASADEFAAGQFMSLTPQNLSMTPSKLRALAGLGGLGALGAGEYFHNPYAAAGGALLLAAQSPAAWGAAIGGAAAVGKVAGSDIVQGAGQSIASAEASDILHRFYNAR